MSKNAGKRRADEDAAKELVSPLELPELSDEQQKLVDAQNKLHERAEIAVDAATQKIMQPIYAARRDAVKNLPRFWGTALAQHAQLAVLMAGQDDMKALTHLTDLWVEYDQVEPRAFTINFEFSENPYFSDKVLSKEYKYTPPAGAPAPGTNVDANGVSDAQEAFEWETHVTPQAIKINWKDDGHNLTKLSPLIVNPEDAEDIEELGSFFNWFELGPDSSGIGPTIVQEFYPEALKYYRGEGEMGRAMVDSDDEMDSDDDEEDDDDDDEEIDLEQPRKKKSAWSSSVELGPTTLPCATHGPYALLARKPHLEYSKPAQSETGWTNPPASHTPTHRTICPHTSRSSSRYTTTGPLRRRDDRFLRSGHSPSVSVVLPPAAPTALAPHLEDEGPGGLPLNLSDSNIAGAGVLDRTDEFKVTATHDDEDEKENDQGANPSTSPVLNFVHSLFQARPPAPVPIFSHSTEAGSSKLQFRTRSHRASALTVPIPAFDLAPCVELPSSDGEGDSTGLDSSLAEEDNRNGSSEGPVQTSHDFLVSELQFESSPVRTEATEVDEASHASTESGDLSSSPQFTQEPSYPHQSTRGYLPGFFHPRPTTSTPFIWTGSNASWLGHSHDHSQSTDDDQFSDFDDHEHGHGYGPWNDTPLLSDASLLRTGSPNTLFGARPSIGPYRAATPPVGTSDWGTPEPEEPAGYESYPAAEYFDGSPVIILVQREASPFGGPINLANDDAEDEASGQGSEEQEGGEVLRGRPIEVRRLAIPRPFVRTGTLSLSPKESLSGFYRGHFHSSLDDLSDEQIFGFRSETPTPHSMHGNLSDYTSSPAPGLDSGDYSHSFLSMGGGSPARLQYPPEALSSPTAEITHTYPCLVDWPYAPAEPRTGLLPAAPIDPSAYTSQNNSLGSQPDGLDALENNTRPLGRLQYPPEALSSPLEEVTHAYPFLADGPRAPAEPRTGLLPAASIDPSAYTSQNNSPGSQPDGLDALESDTLPLGRLQYPPDALSSPLAEVTHAYPRLVDCPYAPAEPRTGLLPAAPIDPSAYTSQNNSLGSQPDGLDALESDTLPLGRLQYPPGALSSPTAAEVGHVHPFLADGPCAPAEPRTGLLPASPIDPSAYTWQNNSLASQPDGSDALEDSTHPPLRFLPPDTRVSLPLIHIAVFHATVEMSLCRNADIKADLKGTPELVRHGVTTAPQFREVNPGVSDGALSFVVPFLG